MVKFIKTILNALFGSRRPQINKPMTIPASLAKKLWESKSGRFKKILKEGPMRINENGIKLIKKFEGINLNAYPDPATGGAPWTIGYGHTGPEVEKGMIIDENKALELLYEDLDKFEIGVTHLVQVPLTSNQFSALVSFSYNLGLNNLENSTLLKKLNCKDYEGAAQEFKKWVNANGKKLSGLIKRRAAEEELFSFST